MNAARTDCICMAGGSVVKEQTPIGQQSRTISKMMPVILGGNLLNFSEGRIVGTPLHSKWAPYAKNRSLLAPHVLERDCIRGLGGDKGETISQTIWNN